MRIRTHCFRTITALCALLVIAPAARADDIDWISSGGGSFQFALNWSSTAVPGPGDGAFFNLDGGYTVDLFANVTNQSLIVHTDSVTLDLGGFQYEVTSFFGVGIFAGHTGSLTLRNGSFVGATAVPGNIGLGEGSAGHLFLTGPATTLSASIIVVGGNSVANTIGAFTVAGGAVADFTQFGGNTPVIIGHFDGNIGTVNVIGTNSALNVDTAIEVGFLGDGTLNVSANGSVSAHNLRIAQSAGSTGTVNLSTGADLTVTGELNFGAGDAAFTLLSAATADTGPVTLGTVTGSSVSVLVSDADTVWSLEDSFTIGTAAPADITVQSGGLVEKQDPQPYIVGPLGQVTVTGGGLLSTGGTVTPGGLTTVGTAGVGTATLTVSGAGSIWETFGPVEIGLLGEAVLTVDSGGLVETTNPSPWIVGPLGQVTVTGGGILQTGGTETPGGLTRIGTAAGGTASVLVSGADSLWESFGPVEIGIDGPALVNVTDLASHKNPDPFIVGPMGQVTITAGATLETGASTIGTGPGGEAIVEIDGAGTTWEINGSASIGELGPGIVTVATDAVMAKDPDPFIVGPEGQVFIITGGQLITQGPARLGTAAGGTALMTIGDGSRWDSFGPTLEIGVDGPAALSLDAGAVMKKDPEPFIVGPEGLIEGLGTLIGDPTSSGEFFPGFGFGEVGTLTVDGNYTQLSGGRLHLELDGTGPGEFSTLAVTGTARLEGTLHIQTTFAPSVGDSFEALSYTTNVGEFDIITGLDLGGVTSYGLDFAGGSLTLTADQTVGLTVVPAGLDPIQIDVGQSIQLAARTLLAGGGGANASAESDWSSSSAAIAAVSSLGLVTGMAEGLATMSASFQGFSDSVSVTVGECPADLDGNGVVEPFDLALVLGAWGPSSPGAPDFDGDGNVGPFDLAYLLGNWGPCP